MADTLYDLIVIGGGPAGYSCAIRAAQLGLTTALIEAADKLGGTCLHVGCVPAKAILFSAEIFDHTRKAGSYGIDNVENGSVNWKQVLARKQSIIDKHVNGLNFLMRKNKITVIQGLGRLAGASRDGMFNVNLERGDRNETVSGKRVVIATGSDARMLPGYEVSDRILTNIEFLSMSHLPKSIVIIGSGAVGVEFASAMKSFNVDVSIIEMLDRVVPAEDREISKELARQFRKRGIDIHVSAKVDRIENQAEGVAVHFTKSDGTHARKEAEKVLVATGRAPRTHNVGIETTRIELERGFVKTNEWMETAEPGVFAVGDIVSGLPQLAHAGIMSGATVAAHIAGKYAKPVTRHRVPGCTYCEPQIASIGFTEEAAKDRGFSVKVGKFPFAGNSKASILDNHEGVVKVVADATYGEILGVHIIGPSATEIIAEAVTAIDAEMPIEEMMTVLHAHPTVAESLLDGFSAVLGMTLNA